MKLPPDQLFEQTYVRPREGRTLIVGSKIFGQREDRRLRYRDAVGVDMQAGDGVDVVVDLEDEDEISFADLGPFAHIECLSVLEHSRRPWLLAENMQRLLEPGGTIFLSVPFVWRFHGYPNDYFRFTAEGVRALFPLIRWEQLQYASDRLRPDHYLPGLEKAAGNSGHPHLPRCEVMGFGARAA